MQQSAARVFGDYIAGLSLDDLPIDVVEKANDCLLDSIGCLLGAHGLPLAGILEGFVKDVASIGSSPILGSDRRADPGTAAFVHATLINALDFDDIYRKGHPGATVISAALTVAAHVDSSGLELLAAIIAGYEVSGRIAMSLTHLHPRKTIHGHGTWQVFGAVAAASKLLKLDPMQSAHAMAIAAANAPVASVMKTVYGHQPTMAKNNFGTAAQAGVNAAFLAKNGFEGPLDIFEGETGFWRMAGADGSDYDRLRNGLGQTFEIRAVGFKPFSCCRILQSSIQASVLAFSNAKISPAVESFKRLVVTAPSILCEPPFSQAEPKDAWAAQFSAPYALAMALLEIEPGPAWSSETWLRSEAVAEFTAKVELRAHDRESAPGSHHAATAQLHAVNGQVFEAEVKVALGEAENPLARQFLEEKYRRLAIPRIGMVRAERLLADVIEIRDCRSINHVLKQLGPENSALMAPELTSCDRTCDGQRGCCRR
jgi:2-methylcitrate dehydratase PrpD